ncbi:enolase C-terminal domain-like protein [Streptomyces decoyicus]|uniref:enolase C-terminal domain-like protein n=1 Tax=Streptomyces decoyicus TaxID=249567 RepID=UPI0036406209
MTCTLAIAGIRTSQVPLHRPFAHARHAHARTGSVLLTLELDGVTGWGEGAPRPYVTGETLTGAVQALEAFDPSVLGPLIPAGDFPRAVGVLASLDLPRLLGGLRPMPAAAAALETALLDALCRRHGVPMSAVLDACPWAADVLTADSGPRTVSEVVDLSRTPVEQLEALPPGARARLTHIKLKALDSPEETVERALQVRGLLGSSVRLSVDANGGWEPRVAEHGARLLRERAAVDWIEEPTLPRDWSTLRRIQESGTPVMLDESAMDTADVEWAAATGAASFVNIRISKCGGLLPSLRMAVRARELGLRCQVGVQVGEIGPLWSVGRTLAARLAEVVAVECGRQDEWFPTPLTDPPYAVDREHHTAPPPPGPGHGLRPADALTAHLTGTTARNAGPETTAPRQGVPWTSHDS